MKPVDVLIVDDDEDFRPLLLQKLKRSGMHVDGAANAAEALDLAQRRQFDVAIFDMQMPGMSGLELLEKYKSQFP
ncbi:response regulator [Anatilimnocola sp. NA78]|uniref:response regulator n=1 Tax=Anatilimnocola sp. NA78 TaxID=3415683 RepID=UPI003CE59F46